MIFKFNSVEMFSFVSAVGCLLDVSSAKPTAETLFGLKAMVELF